MTETKEAASKRARLTLEYEAPVDVARYRSSLVVFANGVKHELSNVDPSMTLLEWLRSVGLTGTKLGCGEGGCGACTVMVSSCDHAAGGVIRHAAVNACLMPVGAADWCAVTTVEGIGNTRKGLHPVQERLTALHGSQCGFCTPGIVMAVYTLLRTSPELGATELQEHLDGNLCRCTGYRPILDAARSLCADTCGAKGCANSEAGKGCASDGSGGCPNVEESVEGTAGAPSCRHTSGEPAAKLIGEDVVTSSADKLEHYAQPYATSAAASAEPPFPEELAATAAPPLRLAPSGVTGATWWRPASLADLLALKQAEPGARIVVGATETTIEARFKNHPAKTFLAAGAVAELRVCEDTAEAMLLGACAPLADVEKLCAAAAAARPGREGEAARACGAMLRWFASTQIRNVACLGGNIATASPISDMIPLLTACGATLTLASAARGERDVPMVGFFVGYRKTALLPDELIVRVRVPHTLPLEFLRPFKQARRREDDISIVTGGLRVRLGLTPQAYVVESASLAFGGLAPTVVEAPKTAAALLGQEWSAATLDAACQVLLEELRVAPSAPGGQPEYRSALAASALFKFFVSTSVDLTAMTEAGGAVAGASAGAALPPPPVVSAAERSAGRSWLVEPKPPTDGTQRYPHASYPGLEAAALPGIADMTQCEAAKAGGVRVVGESLPHAAGARHTTGEAEYVDDAPLPPGTLHACLVRAAQAPATLSAIDATAARAMPGVERVLFAEDLPQGGINSIGPIAKDELCFAESFVEHVGQVIGIVVAADPEQARLAAAHVAITYGPPPPGVTPCYTIDDAIAAGSFFNTGPFSTDHDLEAGPPVEQALTQQGLITVRGEMRIGGQEHFYLEPNTSLVTPTDDGGLAILASTQAVDKTQKLASRVTGIPCHKVVAKVKRMGGGFGGKETRSVFASCAAAVAAHVLQRPVRLSLKRDVDMGTSGGRHPFYARYVAAASPTGGASGGPRLVGLDVQLYSNGGAMLDLSGPIMDRALLHIDNVYKWPSFRARGVVCKTHTPPNTAFRGFGGPQGMLITETVISHLATALGVHADDLRANNLYAEGDTVPFGQVFGAGEWRVPRAWAEVREEAQVEARRAEVAAFNAANKWRKRGLAVVPTKYGINFTAKFMNQGGALVHLYTDGTILVSHGGTEMGQGLHTKVCQVAARAFGVPLAAVHVAETSTNAVANSSPTAGSVSNDLYCMATLDACRQILERLEPLRLDKPTATLADLAMAAFFSRIDMSAHGYFAVDTKRCGFDWTLRPGTHPDGTPDQTARGHPFNYFTQGVGVVEVEIDVLTGDHEVRRADLLVDLGSSINPALDVGQIEGAFTQGMGWTTTEELVWGDAAHPWVRPAGRLHTSGPGTYKIPAFNDVPRALNVRLMSGVSNKFAVHSSKAVGEPPFFLGAAVFFAIRDAIGAARSEHAQSTAHFTLYSPATSERIRLACADRFAIQAMADALPADGDALTCKGSF